MRVGKASGTEKLGNSHLRAAAIYRQQDYSDRVCDLVSLPERTLVLYRLIKSCSRDVLIIFFRFSMY